MNSKEEPSILSCHDREEAGGYVGEKKSLKVRLHNNKEGRVLVIATK